MRTSNRSKGRVYGGRGARERKQERRRRLMDAGIALFGTQGYANTTVKQLCAEAGLTERYLYESFANREALFIAVGSECATGLMGALALAKTRAPNDPDAQVDAMVETFFRWFRDDPRRVRVQLIDPGVVGPATQEIYAEIVRAFIHFTQESVREWYERHLAERSVDADLLATMLVGGLIEGVKEWARTGFELPLEVATRTGSLPFHAMSEALVRT